MIHLYLSSLDSLSAFPDNLWYDFTVLLPKPLDLQGVYSCALLEIDFDKKLNKDVYLFCDMCEYSYLRDGYQPILRVIQKTSVFTKLIYIPVKTSRINTIRIYIRDEEGQVPSLNVKSCRCTISLKNTKKLASN